MDRSTNRRRRAGLASALVLLAILVSACGGAATPSPTPSPSPSPTADPSAAASGAAVDPTAALAIDAPYTLVDLPPAIADSLESSLSGAIAAYGGLFTLGARQVDKDGVADGSLVVMGLPPVLADNSAAIDQIMAGITSSTVAGSTPTTTTIGGVEVTTLESSGQQFALFTIGPALFMVFGATTDAVTAIAGALISANA
jgi:hypothetical protein